METFVIYLVIAVFLGAVGFIVAIGRAMVCSRREFDAMLERLRKLDEKVPKQYKNFTNEEHNE